MTNPAYTSNRKRQRDLFLVNSLFGQPQGNPNNIGMALIGLGGNNQNALLNQNNNIYQNPNPNGNPNMNQNNPNMINPLTSLLTPPPPS